MSAPPPPAYSTATEDKSQYPTGPSPQHGYPPYQQPQPQQPYAGPSGQPVNPQQPYGPPPPQPQQYPPQPQPYPQPPGAYYQAPSQGPTVIVAPTPMAGIVSMFPPDPIQTTCPNCQQSVLTQTSHEMGALVWFCVFVLCIFGCILCAWIPCVIDVCKDVVHTCPSCGAIVGRHMRLGGGYGGYGGYGRRRGYY